MASDDLVLIAGTANPELAVQVAAELGVPLGPAEISRFPDGEVHVELGEDVQRRVVVLIQPTGPPTDTHVVELLSLADAARRGGASRVIGVVPYFGYSRAERREGRRTAVTASLVARLMETAGISHIVVVDLHAEAIEGFFQIPLDEISGVPTLAEAVRGRLPAGAVVVSPDAGRVRMASAYARRLESSVVVLHKQREDATRAEVTRVVGEVRGRNCLIVDDMISTGGTIEAAVEALLEAGAKPPLFIASTHGLLVGRAFERLDRTEIGGVFVTDTVAVPDPTIHPVLRNTRLEVVPMAPVLAQAIDRIVSPDGFERL